MTATIPAPLTEHLSEKRCRFLADIFTTACEGGIQYWAVLISYHWQADREPFPGEVLAIDFRGFKAVVAPSEDEWGVFDDERDKLHLAIDITTLERGVRLFRRYCHGEIDSQGKVVAESEQKPLRDDHYWRQFLEAEATNGEGGDYDAEVADQIVQWGLFGQAVYG